MCKVLASVSVVAGAAFGAAAYGIDVPVLSSLGLTTTQLAAAACGFVAFAAAILANMSHSKSARESLVLPLVDDMPASRKFSVKPNFNGRMMRNTSMRAEKETVDVTKQLDQWYNKESGKDDVAVGEENFDVKNMAGVLPPVGFFDPAGFSKGKTEQRMRWFRESELKHGRVAMLAALGFVVGENFHPLFGGDIQDPAAFAFQHTPLQTFWGTVVTALAFVEAFQINKIADPLKNGFGVMRPGHELGNLDFDPLGLKPKDPASLRTVKNKELQNGRLAMLGIAGMIAQELVNHQKLFGSPVSAAEVDQIHAIATEMTEMLNGTMDV